MQIIFAISLLAVSWLDDLISVEAGNASFGAWNETWGREWRSSAEKSYQMQCHGFALELQ